MIGAQRIEVACFVSIEILEPYDAGDAVDAVRDFCGLSAPEFFATTTHGYNSRERLVTSGESGGSLYAAPPTLASWWAMRASIPRLLRCERSALPTELIALGDSRG